MDKPDQQDSGAGQRRSGLGLAASLGFDIAAGVGLFTALGYWLDRRRGGGQRWTLIGLGLGVLYAGYEFWKAIRQIEEQERNRKAAGKRRPGGEDGNA